MIRFLNIRNIKAKYCKQCLFMLLTNSLISLKRDISIFTKSIIQTAIKKSTLTAAEKYKMAYSCCSLDRKSETDPRVVLHNPLGSANSLQLIIKPSSMKMKFFYPL